MCVVVYVLDATRVVGHYTMVVPGDSSWAASGRRQMSIGVRVPCSREGLGSEALVARRLACGGGWEFERGRERRPRAAANCSFAQDRCQTSPQGWRRS